MSDLMNFVSFGHLSSPDLDQVIFELRYTVPEPCQIRSISHHSDAFYVRVWIKPFSSSYTPSRNHVRFDQFRVIRIPFLSGSGSGLLSLAYLACLACIPSLPDLPSLPCLLADCLSVGGQYWTPILRLHGQFSSLAKQTYLWRTHLL